jgi:hypothetical protein
MSCFTPYGGSERRVFAIAGVFFPRATAATQASCDRKGPTWPVFEHPDKHLSCQMVQTLRELFMALSLPFSLSKAFKLNWQDKESWRLRKMTGSSLSAGV